MTNAQSSDIAFRPGHPAVRRTLKIGITALTKALMRVEVAGRSNLPAGGPLIVASNHLSHCDPLLMGVHLPWTIESLALSDLFHVPITGQFLRLYGVIPVYREAPDRSAMRSALEVLERGGIITILPEGRISVTGALERGRTGVAYLTLTTGVPVLPVAFAGTESVLSDLKRLRRNRVAMTIGAPMSFGRETLSLPDDRNRLREVADEIMSRIASMLPEKYRGVYATPSSATTLRESTA